MPGQNATAGRTAAPLTRSHQPTRRLWASSIAGYQVSGADHALRACPPVSLMRQQPGYFSVYHVGLWHPAWCGRRDQTGRHLERTPQVSTHRPDGCRVSGYGRGPPPVDRGERNPGTRMPQTRLSESNLEGCGRGPASWTKLCSDRMKLPAGLRSQIATVANGFYQWKQLPWRWCARDGPTAVCVCPLCQGPSSAGVHPGNIPSRCWPC